MSCEDATAELLRRAGHKMTPQRLMILRALRHATGHVSATQIADEVRESYPFVDVSTVYRTLDVLKRMGLVTATDLGQGDVLFEWAQSEPHHHLVCQKCRAIEDLDHGYLTELGSRIKADLGFAPSMHHFAIFGLCRECQESGVTSDHQA